MKIYRVIFKCTDLDEYYNAVTITTFQNKELAEQYLKEKIETENCYERFLDDRVMEDSVSIYLEEDETYDEIMLKEKAERLEKETNYEM